VSNLRLITVTVDLSSVQEEMASITRLGDVTTVQRIITDTLVDSLDASMLGEMHGKASGLGRMHARAASGLNYQRLSDGVRITAGGVPWVGGSEFGGQVKIMTYQTTSRAGNPYTVTRHTTMQFNPWRGQTGYWMWPTITERMQGIRKKLIESMINAALGKVA